jgi:hypothetical protein
MSRVMTMALASSGQEGTITTNLHSVVDVQSHDNGLGLQRPGRDNKHVTYKALTSILLLMSRVMTMALASSG